MKPSTPVPAPMSATVVSPGTNHPAQRRLEGCRADVVGEHFAVKFDEHESALRVRRRL